MADLNVKLDNLCTFLPQDKVGNFSGLSMQQLLEETEKTLAPWYHKTHMDIEEMEAKLAGQQGDTDALLDKLKKMKHENQALERAAELMAEREEALRSIEVLEGKKLWLEFDELRNRYAELSAKKKAIKAKLKDAAHEIAPLQERRDELKAETDRLLKEVRKHEDNESKHKKG